MYWSRLMNLDYDQDHFVILGGWILFFTVRTYCNAFFSLCSNNPLSIRENCNIYFVSIFTYFFLSQRAHTHTHTQHDRTEEPRGGKEGRKCRIAYTIKISEVKSLKAACINKGQLGNGYWVAVWRLCWHKLFLFEVNDWASLEKLPNILPWCSMIGGT